MKESKEPKIKPTFEGCYNYKKLKEEGLIEEKDEDWKEMYVDLNNEGS